MAKDNKGSYCEWWDEQTTAVNAAHSEIVIPFAVECLCGNRMNKKTNS